MDIRQGIINILSKKSVKFQPTYRGLDLNWLGNNNPNTLATDPFKQLQEGYESNIDVFSVIKKIADSFVAVPTIIERRTVDGWELFEDSTIQDLIDNHQLQQSHTCQM